MNLLLKTPSPITKALGFGASLLAAVAVVGSAQSANAATFSFSFNNQDGPVAGTVAGTITLPDGDGTFAATALTIDSAPAALGYTTPINALLGNIGFNTFTVTGGSIVAATSQFANSAVGGNILSAFSLNLPPNGSSTLRPIGSGSSSDGVLDQDSSTLVYSAAASTPEPSTIVGLGLLGLGALVSRKRKA